MKVAFCLFKYFPYGGLQRDFLRIAKALYARGHEVHVYTMKWEGSCEAYLPVHIIKVKGWQNHTRIRSYVENIKKLKLAAEYDLIIGFNKMPHLDIYYAADICYKARAFEKHSFLYRLLPRYRQFVAFEKAVFRHGTKTDVLMISPREQATFMRWYQTEPDRFHHLPPGISKNAFANVMRGETREKMRLAYQIPSHHFLLLFIGSGFKTKGLDRAIKALAALPSPLRERCHLFVIGKDKPSLFQTLANQLQVSSQVYFLGGRSDVVQFLLAADLLLHPAYHENTGTVLLEALAAGLPVLTVDSCGYAHYIKEAEAGVVLTSPLEQIQFNVTFEKMLLSEEHEVWRQNALAFAKKADIYSLPEKAADEIETCWKKNGMLSIR